MTIYLGELKAQRDQVARDMENMVKQSKESGTPWTADNKAKFEEATTKYDFLNAQVKLEQRKLDQAAQDDISNELVDHSGHLAKQARSPEAKLQFAMFSSWIRAGESRLTEEEAVAFSNTMSTGTGSEGGFTVPSLVNPTLIDILKDFGAMRQVATVMRTDTGVPFPYPRSDGTAEEGEIVPENTTANDADPVFGTVPMPVYMYSSKTVTIPVQLIQDSAIDVVSFVGGRLMKRLGRITNRHFTAGTGSGQPPGVAVAASVGRVGATGQVTGVTYGALVDLTESVDIAYHPNASFMFGQAMRGTIRQLVDGSNRPIWLPSYDAGIQGGAPDRLLGYPVKVNNYMPSPAANAKSIAFGDLSSYVIRDVGGPTVQRYEDSAYAKKRTVGYQAWMRSGGNLTDTAAVKLYQHSAS